MRKISPSIRKYFIQESTRAEEFLGLENPDRPDSWNSPDCLEISDPVRTTILKVVEFVFYSEEDIIQGQR